jgi:hypothetical protein
MLGVVFLVPAATSAQLVDTTDPCYVAFYGADRDNVLARGSWENRDHLTRAAVELRLLAESLTGPAVLAVAANATPEILDRLRAQYRCLDWLRRFQRRLEEQMKKLGLKTVSLPNERRQLTVDEIMRDIRDFLVNAGKQLEKILRR